VVERARLESVYTVLSRIEGSNPSLSANYTWVYTGHMVYTLFRPPLSGQLLDFQKETPAISDRGCDLLAVMEYKGGHDRGKISANSDITAI
jgi:hypothetical protein